MNEEQNKEVKVENGEPQKVENVEPKQVENVEPQKVISEKNTSSDKWLNVSKFILSTALIALVVNFPGLYMVKKSQSKIGVVDVQALLLEHEKKITQELYANQGLYQNSDTASLNNGAIEQKTKQFVQKLESSIDEINKNCGCVLINKAALLTQSGNVFDYTQKVREALEK